MVQTVLKTWEVQQLQCIDRVSAGRAEDREDLTGPVH